MVSASERIFRKLDRRFGEPRIFGFLEVCDKPLAQSLPGLGMFGPLGEIIHLVGIAFYVV